MSCVYNIRKTLNQSLKHPLSHQSNREKKNPNQKNNQKIGKVYKYEVHKRESSNAQRCKLQKFEFF